MSPRGGPVEMFRVAFPPPLLWPYLQRHVDSPRSERQPTAVPLMQREPHPPICARGVPALPSVCFSAVEVSLWLLLTRGSLQAPSTAAVPRDTCTVRIYEGQ